MPRSNYAAALNPIMDLRMRIEQAAQLGAYVNARLWAEYDAAVFRAAAAGQDDLAALYRDARAEVLQ